MAVKTIRIKLDTLALVVPLPSYSSVSANISLTLSQDPWWTSPVMLRTCRNTLIHEINAKKNLLTALFVFKKCSNLIFIDQLDPLMLVTLLERRSPSEKDPSQIWQGTLHLISTTRTSIVVTMKSSFLLNMDRFYAKLLL